MSDRMYPLEFSELLRVILGEYEKRGSIFGIPKEKFYYHKQGKGGIFDSRIFGDLLETPVGPAAGPHTQLAQNIISSYLTGARFIELKTVQIMDELEIEKPCIDARDECYNTEWSQELKLEQSIREYVKAWIIIHILKEYLNLSDTQDESGFIFNMSVGYDLKGIKEKRMDKFIETIKDASSLINEYKDYLYKEYPQFAYINIPTRLANSVTVSTMHGCPPDEIESIGKYLLEEKGFHTYIKLNPTLLGQEVVESTLKKLGYYYISFKKETFDHDLKYKDAIKLIKNLQSIAQQKGLSFGVKLSNTLANINQNSPLPGEERYMSGRALYPLTLTLATKLAKEFDGKLNISFSGGASYHNIDKLIEAGCYPITMATDLLRPGGYMRFKQILQKLGQENTRFSPFKENSLKVDYLRKISQEVLKEKEYRKSYRKEAVLKIKEKLPLVDCIKPPCMVGCPIHQNVPEYIRLVQARRYDEALEVIMESNALPHMTAWICEHICMTKCVRWDYDHPLLIRELKKVAVENGSYEIKGKDKIGKSVAVIGGGPAGISAAFFLLREGFDVTIYEKEKELGGTVRYIIPPFRLSNEAIEADVELIKKLGVKIETEAKDVKVKDLKKKFDYVIIATGAQKGKELKIPGTDKEGYVDAVEILYKLKNREINREELPKKVVVIGGGNSAMDVARSFKLLGAEVTIVYRRTMDLMPADMEEIEAALEDGVEFKNLLSPIALLTKKGKVVGIRLEEMELGELDESGRPKPVSTGKEVVIEADLVVGAIGEEGEKEFLVANGIKVDDKSRVEINKVSGETNIKNVFAVGDAVQGPSSVVQAIADARMVANYLVKKEKDYEIIADKYYERNGARASTYYLRHGQIVPPEKLPALSPEKREYDKVILGMLSEDSASREGQRCFGCNYICSKCVEVCPNRANYQALMDEVEFAYHYFEKANKVEEAKGKIEQLFQIYHFDPSCNECGNCYTFCPYEEGKPYLDKFTYFKEKSHFEDSKNPGFYRYEDGKYLVRMNEEVFEIEVFENKVNFNNQFYSFVYDVSEKKLLEYKWENPKKAKGYSTEKLLVAYYLIANFEKRLPFLI